MKMKVIKEYEEGNTTCVFLQTRLGIFKGVAKFNATLDPLPPSKVTGHRIAELRAYKAYFKEEAKLKKAEIKGLKRLISALPSNKDGFKYAERLINAIEKELREYEDNILECDKLIRNCIESRNIYIKSRTTNKAERNKKLKELGDAIAALKTVTQDKNN